MAEELYTREEARSLKIGLWVAFAIFLIVGLTIFARKNVSYSEGGKYYQLLARFNRTDGLLVGDLVRVAGMNVGKVVAARLDDNFKAILTLDIKEGVLLPDDSSASIVSSGLMGAKYIEIEPGGSMDMLPPGGEFSYTQDAMVLEELLDRIVGIGKANRKNASANNKNSNEEKVKETL